MDKTTTSNASNPGVYQQLGQITRQLHDTLAQLGVMPKLQQAAQGLPDARSRLNYVAQKTAEAADKVLNSVDAAKLEQRQLLRHLEHLEAMQDAVASREGLDAHLAQAREALQRVDGHLTDIMLAQDFHDLTAQVVGKVLRIATELEDSLVRLLVQAAPAELEAAMADAAPELAGPVVDAAGRSDVVSNQSEVDDLLSSLGF